MIHSFHSSSYSSVPSTQSSFSSKRGLPQNGYDSTSAKTASQANASFKQRVARPVVYGAEDNPLDHRRIKIFQSFFKLSDPEILKQKQVFLLCDMLKPEYYRTRAILKQAIEKHSYSKLRNHIAERVIDHSFEECVAAARNVPVELDRDLIHKQIILGLAEAKYYKDCFQLITQIAEPSISFATVYRLAEILVKAGREKLAEQLAQQLPLKEKSICLRKISLALTQQGTHEKAQQIAMQIPLMEMKKKTVVEQHHLQHGDKLLIVQAVECCCSWFGQLFR